MKKNKFTEQISKIELTDEENERITKGAKVKKSVKGRVKLIRLVAIAVVSALLITAAAVVIPMMTKEKPAEIPAVTDIFTSPEIKDTAGKDGVITGSASAGNAADTGEGLWDKLFPSEAEGGKAAAADSPSALGPTKGEVRASEGSYDPVKPDSSSGGSTDGNADYQPGVLTAARWNDNGNFDFYLNVLNREEWKKIGNTWKLIPNSRYAVNVPGCKGAKVALADSENNVLYRAVTDNNGDAYLYYNTSSVQDNQKPAYIYVKTDAATVTYTITGNEQGTTSIPCEPQNKALKLDLMFMIDATGSMGDEMEYIKTELKDVISRVKADNGNIGIRLSVNFYKDTTDEYIVKYFDFDTDVDRWVSILSSEQASGGGDTPEAVDTALDNAVAGHSWDTDAVKIMFFVLDAPPHSDRQGSVESISKSIKTAAESGIRIVPIASSGVDTETEYLLRAMAAMSGGEYVFLTDDSGIGGTHLEASVGEHEVKKLNDLMVEIIGDYLK